MSRQIKMMNETQKVKSKKNKVIHTAEKTPAGSLQPISTSGSNGNGNQTVQQNKRQAFRQMVAQNLGGTSPVASAPRATYQGPMAVQMPQDNPYMKAAVRQMLPAYQRPVDPITAAAANMLRNNARGNIDLYNRPQYRQPDGSISTVNSISIGTTGKNGDKKETLIPTIGRDKNGRPVQWTDEEAIDHYYKTGENLGKFNTVEEADDYAEKLHRQQEAYYSPENSPLRLNNVIPKPYEIGEGIQRFESGGQIHQNDPEADKYIEKSIRTSKNPFANSGINSTIDPQTGDVTYTAEHGRNNWLNDYNVQENLESDEARKARTDALNLLIARGRGDGRSRYESTVLQNMNEDEQKEYSYLLGKFGREQAEKYLDRIGEQVTNRRAAEIVENVNRDVVPDEGNIPTSYVNPRTGEVIENARSGKNPVNSLARAGKMGKLAAQSGLDMFVSGVGDKFTNYVTGGTEATPATAEARASQAVKEQLNPLGRLAYDVVENEAMMLPTQAATVAAALLFPPLAPAAASVGTGASIGTLAAAKAAADAPQIFGIGATMFPMSAGQAYEEGLQKGLTPDQARFYGTLEGLNQAGLEYALGGFEDLSGGFAKQAVDNVLGNVVADETKSQAAQTVARAIQHFLTTPEGRMLFSMGSEAFEEIVQGSVSNALNNAFFGENNAPVTQEDLYSGLVAALSVAASNSRYYARGYANGMGRVYSPEDIRAAADNIITDRAAYVNQEAYDAAMERRDQMLAQADYVEQGGNLTPLERSELGDAAGGALAEMDRIGRRARNESDIQEVADTLKTAQEIAQTEETKQAAEKISTRANDIIKRRAEGAQVTDAEVGRLINDTIRTTLTAGNEKAAATAEARTRMGFGEQGNTVMESSQATGQKAEALTALYEEARYDIQRNDAQKQLASTLLSEQEVSAMYQAGIQDRNAFYNTDYSDKIGKIAEKYRPGNIKRGNVTYDGVDMDALQKAGDNESRAKYAQMKTIEHFLAGTLGYNVEWFESKTADGKYEGENGSYNRTKHLIRLDINAGAEVIGDKVKFASVIAHELTHTIEDGSPMQYQKIANTVMKALVADQEYSRGRNAEQIVADMIENNPYVKNEADAIHELVAQACEDMMNGNADVRAMFEGMSESERNTIFDHISNIFAAIRNFFDDLLNSDAVRSNRTEAAAIRRAKDNIESLEKEWTEGVKRAAAYNAAAYEESQRQTAEQASENEQMENAFGDETGRITKDADGNVVIAESEDGQSLVYSLRTLPTTQAKLAEVLKRKGYSEESIKAAQDRVGTVADMLTRVSTYYAEMAEALDAELLVDPKTGKTVLHSFVTNGDYPVNIDFLTICKKREAYMHVLTDLIDHGIFDKVAFDGAAIATTNEILRDSGFETACACCFVESRRLQIQRWAETFCSEWNEEVLKRNPNATPFNFSKGDRGANSLTQEELIELDKELRSLTKKEKNDKGNYKIRQQGARAKMGPLLDRIPALGHTLSVGDLITPNGIDSMRTLDSNLFSLVKQRYGTATPKIAQAFSPYNGDVADLNYGFMRTEIKESITGSKKYKAEAKSALIKEGVKKPTSQQVEDRAIRKYLYDIGGVRLQSFSDFLIENTLDYFQMFADLAAKELPLHAYSKEISFIKIFGMTGGKLNMSLIPIVDLNTDRDHAGLKKNADGTYSYAGWGDYEHHLMIDNRSFIQSIGFKDAIALQLHPGYSSHVGTIAIGISNEHIKMMLNDPLIRMVIPYHSSGMLPEFAKQMHIDYYHDYTKTQNTTLGRCTDMDGNEVAVYNLKGNDSYSCDTHFDFNEAFQRLGDARMACEEYKEWCKQQHPVYYKNKQVGWAEFTPKFVEFAKERNYYKLIEDFNSYDCITEESAIQGAVRMSFPGMEENLLNDEELKAYEERLRATGQFTEKEIQKYVSRANETLEEIVTREAKNRNAYHREMDKKYDSTLKKIEDKLQKNFNKTDYVLKDNKYVRKSGEQKSSRDTAARVGASGEQFAMRGTAEETKDLIAVHNLYEWKMKQLIKLSGLPAPSIAITKANDGWNKFGEISFVYDKDSIDPKKNRKNKIYGADAWTPTFPSVEYRVDTGILNKISEKLGEKIKDLLPQDIARDATNDIQRAQFDLNRMPVEEYVDRMSNSLALKAAYVASKGITVEDQQKVRGSSYKPQAVAGFDSLIEKIGNAVDEVYTEDANEFYDKHKQAILDAYNVYRDAAGLSKFEPADDSPMSRRVLIRFAEKACDYAHDTRANETIRDRDAIEKFVDSHFDRDGFDKWLTPMLSEAVLEEGLYNGKDRYTWSGTRKSWKQTHLPVTAENIVKVMMMGEKTGLASFESKNSFIASAQENFKSIADVKKSKDRIKNLDDAEYKRLTDEVGKEFYKLADEIKSGNYGSQEAAEAIHDAVRKARTVDGIGRELRRWGGLNIGSDTAQRVYDVAKKAASIPTKYFEAKPERVVGFDEVKAAVVPADVAPEIKEWLDKQGITAVTYERDNDADRTRALNSVENVRFSSRNSTGNVSREVVDQVTDASVTAMIDNGYTEKEAAEAVEVGGFVQYSTRTAPAPKKTITAYKAFYAVDGKLYPPMVANDVEEEQNNDKKKSKKKGKKKVSGTLNGMETPVGIWIDADVGALAYDDDGKPLRNTKGRLAVKNAKGGGTLAFRPGWHLGLWPDAKQFNVKDPITGKIKACMPDGLVFARCSVAADNDYQLEALGYGVGSNGKFNRTQAGLPRIPVDGYYMYRTNALPDTAPWIISGAIRVEEILDDDMAAEICKQYGITADPRASHKKINLADYGLKAGPVTPTEDTDRFLPNNAVKANATALEEALNDPAYANAYVANSVNFDDPEIIKELERNGQSAEFYKTAQEKYGNKSYAVDNPNDSLINKNTFAVGSGETKMSSRDSTGRELTERQAEYFKDSKVRDKNGNLKVMYHGTERGGFTVFDPAESDDKISLFFTDYFENAREYSGSYDEITPDRRMSESELRNMIEKITEGDFQLSKVENGYSIDEYVYDDSAYKSKKTFKTLKEAQAYVYEEFVKEGRYGGYGAVPGNYEVYLNLKDPLVIDAQGSYWNEIPYWENEDGELDPATTREIAEDAKEMGYDGVIINNVWDNGPHSERQGVEANIAIAFSSNQVKSAYNENPTENNDIRYSSRTEALDAEYQEALDAKNEDWQLMLVDQAAYNAGYTVGAYHGSPFENIHIFNTRSQETKKTKMQLLFGTHFTHNLEYAKLYARKAKNSKGTSRMTSKTGQIYKTYLNLGKSLDLRTARNITPGMEEYKLYEDAPAKYQRHFKPYTFSKYDTEQGLGSGQYITAATIQSVLQAMSPKEATDFLVDHGYNSILYDADYTTPTSGNNRFTRDPSIIMLDPERIKSGDPVTYDDNGNVIPLSERFNPANEDIRYSSRNTGNATTFYSKLQREIQNYKGEKIGAASVESYLKGKGVKDEEIKWSGIRTFLEGKKSVNKQELMQYLRDNELQIEEKILGGATDNGEWTNGYNTVNVNYFYDPVSGMEFKDEESFKKEALKKAAEDHYNESELVFNISDDYMSVESEDGDVIFEAYQPDTYDLRDSDYYAVNGTQWESYKLDGGKNYREILFSIPSSDYINDPMRIHWKGKTGVLAHTRVQDFDAADGGKVLFIEEIQSDWHNAGQKKGYRDTDYAVKRESLHKEENGLSDQASALARKANNLSREVSKRIFGTETMYNFTRGILTFGKEYAEYDDASEAERVWNSLTDEEKQISRDRKRIDDRRGKIDEEIKQQNLGAPDAPFRSNYTDYVLKNLLRMAAEGNYDYLAWTTSEMQMDRWNPERLPTNKMTGSGSSDDVAFEEGYRIEYDQQIPKFLKKYGKQWGAGLQNVKIYGGWDRAGNAPYVPAITVNELMKESVLTEGQPMFSARSNSFDQRTSFGTVEELERRNENIWHINYTLDQVLRDRGAQTQKVSDYQIKRIANRFIREYNSKADADTIAEGLKAMYEYIDYGAKISAQQVGKIATAYAEQIIDESKDVDDTMAAMYPGLADDIKRTKLYVSPEAMKEMAYYFDGAADFRRQAKKFLTISERPGDGRGIDTFYEELSENYPELFDPDVANEKDQLLQIFDVAEQLKAKTIDKDWGSEYDEVAYTLGQDLVAAYFAEKGDSSYKRSIDQIKVQMAKDHKEQMANLRRYKDQQIKEIKDKLTGERRMNTAQIAELRARLQEQYRQREEKASLRRLTTQAKAKLQRQARQLWSKRGTPEFERLKAKLFSELDLVSVGITKGGRLSLEKTYNEAIRQAALDPDYAASADYENIKLKFLGDPANPAAERKHLRDLSYEEIVDLTQDIIALKHSQQTYDKVLKENFEASVADYGRRGVAQQGRVKGILNQKGRRAQMLAAVKKYALYMENPVRAAHLLDGYQEGGVLTELFDDINDGTTKKTKFQQQANQMFEEILKDKKLTDGWSDQNIEIDVGAGKYYISKGMRISIALHVRNADNIRHINFGGFKIPNEKLYKAGRYTDAYNAGTQVQMTEEEMKQIASEMTPEEKKFAGIAYQFFNHTTKDAINETSMVLKGYELAVVPNYMPIRTDPNFTQAEIDGLIHDGTIEGKGQFKDRQPGAKNPILLEDIAQVIERQTQTTAAYYGLAIPVRNMNKVWKYTATAYKASMKEAIAQNWGELGKDTIEKMLKDIQAGARRGDTGDHVFSFLKGAQAASTLTMNVGVSMKQFASYPLAISMLDADCLMKGLKAKTDRAYIDSITPWSWDRRHGMGGEEMGDIFKQKGMIARNENIQKVKNMVNWIQAVDVFTTDHLFAACEAQVQKDNPGLEVRGEEYNKKVAALYNDVLWRTQPSYGVMQRNELMRSASTIMKALTMYKTQTFNMGGEIIDAGLRAITMKDMAKDGLVSNDEAKKARQDLKKVLWGTVLSQATLAALSAIAAAALRKMRPYRDDKGEITASSLMQKIGTDFITSWFGLFFGADLAEQAVGSVLNFAQWYDVTAPQLDGLNDTVNDMSAWSTALVDYIEETDADKKAEKKAKLVKTSAKMAMTTAGTFGVPTTNMYNMLNALNLLSQDISDGNGLLSFEAGKGLLGLTDTSPTKEQYARQAVYYSERDDAGKVAHALQGTNKSNLEKVLGMKLTKNLYDSFMDDPENLAKYLNVKQGVSAPKPSDVPDDGYASFTKLREAIGDPERTQNWHHIVEQEQGPGDGNFGRFSATQINNKNNIVSIPSGSKSPHSAISKYYDSVQDFTGGKTVREWLSTKSFEEQFDFGVKQLQKYGDIIPTSNGWVFVPDDKKIEAVMPLEKGKAKERTDTQKRWETQMAELREDGGLSGREVRDAALTMLKDGLTAEEAQELYRSNQKSDKKIDEWKGSFEDYLKGRNAIDDAKAIKDSDKKRQTEKRKQAVENYLSEYHGTREDELLLWKLAGYGEKTFVYR